MNTFHHIGIFCKDLEFGKKEISKFVSVVSSSNEITDEGIGVRIIFLKDSEGIIYELVSAYGENSPVNGVFLRNKDYLNHIAYKTESFEEEIAKLRKEGHVPLGAPKKAKAFNGARVIFFLTPLGFIVEIIEIIKE